MRILQKVTLLILRVFYVLLFGIRFRIHSHSLIMFTSKEPVCPRVELILKIIIIMLIIFLGFIKSKPC